MRRAYGHGPDAVRHPMSDGAIAAAAVVAAVACSASDARLVAAVTLVAVGVLAPLDRFPARVVLVLVAVAFAASVRSAHERGDLTPRTLGTFEGWIDVVDDPQPYPGATRVIVGVDGQRFEVWARGRAFKLRVAEWRAGEFVHVRGERSALDDERAGRVAWQHVVGEFTVDWVTDTAPGDAIARASNRVRAAIERGADVLPGDDGALFRGLVIGDDRDQPRSMIDRFRASGLSHLTAVSGQNVAFLIAAAGPLLRVMRPWVRWVVTLGLIGWFVSLTRFEPSIVRAGAMAALSVTAFVLGRERSPARLLSVAVTVLLLVDPLLVRSVGFWLSVGATWGVIVVGPRLAARLTCFGVLAMPIGITVGAQFGVVVPAVLVFGRLPLVSIPANLLAVPVAGFVMLYGLPAGLIAGWCPPVAPIVMFPCRLGVRWVDTVAELGARLEPGGTATWIGWAVLTLFLLAVAAHPTASRQPIA